MTLSDEELKLETLPFRVFALTDVKEAVKELKEQHCECITRVKCGFCHTLEQIFGEKLI